MFNEVRIYRLGDLLNDDSCTPRAVRVNRAYAIQVEPGRI